MLQFRFVLPSRFLIVEKINARGRKCWQAAEIVELYARHGAPKDMIEHVRSVSPLVRDIVKVVSDSRLALPEDIIAVGSFSPRLVCKTLTENLFWRNFFRELKRRFSSLWPPVYLVLLGQHMWI